MSKKRTSDEFNNDELTLMFKNEDNANRANVGSNSDTTLQDLPMELLECILVKVVATEVIGLKLVKSVWKEKADLVIGRLGTVCSQWSSVLSTNSFRTKLNRILDGTAEKTIRLEFLQEFQPLQSEIRAVTTMNDEIFLLYKTRDKDSGIYIFDRNNMTVVKDVIPLPGRYPVSIVTCKASNCVCVGLLKQIALCLSVLRISKDAEHQFSISPWVGDHGLSIYAMSVTANGNLMIISEKHQWEPHVLGIYDANGFLQQEIQISQDIDASRYQNVIQTANGNFILAYFDEYKIKMKLAEIDSSGSIVRQYQSLHNFGEMCVSLADSCGRIVIAKARGRMELLDSEFNLHGIYDLQQDQDNTIWVYIFDLHYDGKRNEILRVHYKSETRTDLTIFRFTEE